MSAWRFALALALGFGCAGDDAGPSPPDAPAGAGAGEGDGAEQGGGEGEGEGEGEPAPECELGQVLRDGRCLDRCGPNGPVCDPDAEVCVTWEGGIACRARCGSRGGGCGIDGVCLVLRVREIDTSEGFCAPGTCPEGSHAGVDGWCVCDTGDVPPPGLPCRVELCGPGNPQGRCEDRNQVCVDGVCR